MKTIAYFFLAFMAISFFIAQSVFANDKSSNQKLPSINVQLENLNEAQTKTYESYLKGRTAFVSYLKSYAETKEYVSRGKVKKSEFYPYACIYKMNASDFELQFIAKELLGIWKAESNLNLWQKPTLSNYQKQTIKDYLHLEIFLKLLKPYYEFVSYDAEQQITDLLGMLLSHSNQIQNQKQLTFIDLRLHSSKKRFFKFNLIDLPNGKIQLQAFYTSHGRGSDPDKKGFNMGTGYAKDFGNTDPEEMSGKSSIGFYLGSSTYCTRGHGEALRLHGLSDTNDKAYDREIVIHKADYINDEMILSYERVGRSFGCPALDPLVAKGTINDLMGGSLIYLYGEDTADFDPYK